MKKELTGKLEITEKWEKLKTTKSKEQNILEH